MNTPSHPLPQQEGGDIVRIIGNLRSRAHASRGGPMSETALMCAEAADAMERQRVAVVASRALLDAMRDANPSIPVSVGLAVIAARDAIHAAITVPSGEQTGEDG